MEFCEGYSLGTQKLHMFDFKYWGWNLIQSLGSKQHTSNTQAAFFRLEASKMLMKNNEDDLALCFSIFVFSNECNCQDQISGFLNRLILIAMSRHVKLKDSEAEEPAAKISFQPHTLIQSFKLPLR